MMDKENWYEFLDKLNIKNASLMILTNNTKY